MTARKGGAWELGRGIGARGSPPAKEIRDETAKRVPPTPFFLVWAPLPSGLQGSTQHQPWAQDRSVKCDPTHRQGPESYGTARAKTMPYDRGKSSGGSFL